MAEGTPGLLPWQRCNPASYVVGRDLAELDALCERHGGELRQWRLSDELGATALMMVALLTVFRGLRGGKDGCGVQASVEQWCKLLGRSERQVQYAIAQLAERGWVHRRKRRVKVEGGWVDANGRRHLEADVHAVLYLTTKAYVRVARRGETRRLVVRQGTQSRVLVSAGAVGSLLRTLSQKLRVLARRVTDALKRCTPPHRGEDATQLQNRRVSSPVGSHPVFGTGPPEVVGAVDSARLARLTGASRRAGLKMEGSQLVAAWALWREGRLTIGRTWPGAARQADARGRAWLQTQLEHLVAVFTVEELRSRAGGPATATAR